MKDSTIEKIVNRLDEGPVPLARLMRRRVMDILLVSSLYDSYTFEQDGQLTEVLFSQFLELNLRYAPRIEKASTGEEALEHLSRDKFDLVITMPRVGAMDIRQFCSEVRAVAPDVPVVLLTYHTRELTRLLARGEPEGIDRIFTWHGDVRLFLAIIKYIEDRQNVQDDVSIAGVQSIILIEDNISFYSSYLPLLYTELVVQTQGLMSEGLNHMERLIRMRARPKVLLATTYEEGLDLYKKYRDHVLGVITDVCVPRGGELDHNAGIEFAKMVREETWDRAVLVQSSDESHREEAYELGAQFINKNSPTLLRDVREFMVGHLGFGEFIFRLPDGSIVKKVGDLTSLLMALHEIPEESLLYHVTRNHFSLWLMARSEFDLAKALRPRSVEEFENPESLRQYLIGSINEHLERKRIGVIADFTTGTFYAGKMFVRIGNGSLGGKGRGLAFIDSLLGKISIEKYVAGVNIFVPPTAVLATDVFDEFMESNGLTTRALEEADNNVITGMFLKAEMPQVAVKRLRHFLEQVHYPLAVRSSSLQEDASHQPFAGLYRTYMVPNDDGDIEVRLKELCNAIRMVYASTFYADSKSYFDATPNRLEEEKMAIVIQEVVGKRHGNYIYPDFAGVARSYDFYPVKGRDASDGVANVALGLGKMVVDGGKSIRFSPAWPKKLYQFSSVKDYLENAQREFFALDMSMPGPLWDDETGIISNVVQLGLDVAEEHGTLNALGSTYSAENDAVVDGIGRDGVRLVTMAGVLKHGVFPLTESLKFLLEVGSAAFSCPVEIEFAANMKGGGSKVNELAFLQIRPLVIGGDNREVDLSGVEQSDAIVVSESALGDGLLNEIRDVVYVHPDRFDRNRTVEIAGEIEKINTALIAEGRGYILIGPGRWGTADRWFGIPVSWSQISGVQVIVETDIKGVAVQPSQGTHFFHNITSFGIPYFSVNTSAGNEKVDTDWLESVTPTIETGHVSCVRFDEPVQVAVDGQKRRGVILKSGKSVTDYV